ncbi:MAG: hypothetical protein QOJ19_3200 [Acidimicrobiia bacterium]|jgi:uncharacterized protein with von Willebrand factor type A (vWA) domain|nr:hypothetical protein [Acidimicrobiia bacterium]
MARSRFLYSRWDGTQSGFELTADEVLGEITDDLLYHGDLNAALRRLMQSGFRTPDGDRMQGIREMLENLRRKRRDQLERYDLGGVYDDIAQELREVVETEREALEDRLDDASQAPDERQREVTQEAMAERQMQLDMLPPDLAGQVKELQNYDFVSQEAQQRFEELVDKLRQQIMQSQINQMAGAMQDMGPEQMQRMKDMLSELNNMLDQRNRGEDTDQAFQQFMERYGDFFPENPQNLDELLEQIAEKMAAAQAMLNSMTPEQRAQLQGLMDQLLEDMDLRWQLDQLGSNLRQAFPQLPWERNYNFSGQDPLNFSEAAELMQQMGDLDQLENLLRGATNPGALAEVDIDKARELLGDDAARALERMAQVAKMLEEAGLIDIKDGKLELTPRGIRRIGQNALADLFKKLTMDQVGRHALDKTGWGHEREYSTKPYEWGDPFNLDIQQTVRNAVRRSGTGTPVRLTPDDFEVERTEHLVRQSTVLMLDLSLSMPMRDNFLPAKKVAMALHALISSQYPRDYLGLVGFSSVAREFSAAELPEVSWDYVYGTNMQHGLAIARQLLGRQTGTKQIIMITDGEPTAHIEDDGSPYFAYPPEPETIRRTLREVGRCTREGIVINTFMLDATSYLKQFIEKVAEMNRGRAFFTTPDTLGDYVLVDFIQQKRKLIGGRARR